MPRRRRLRFVASPSRRPTGSQIRGAPGPIWWHVVGSACTSSFSRIAQRSLAFSVKIKGWPDRLKRSECWKPLFAVSTRSGPSRPAALSRARSTLQEKADLFEESIAGRLMLQEQMVSTGQGDEMSAGDTGGQLAPCVERTYDVAPHMHDKNRRLHFGQIGDIEIADDIEISRSALGRGRFQLQLVEISGSRTMPTKPQTALGRCSRFSRSFGSERGRS